MLNSTVLASTFFKSPQLRNASASLFSVFHSLLGAVIDLNCTNTTNATTNTSSPCSDTDSSSNATHLSVLASGLIIAALACYISCRKKPQSEEEMPINATTRSLTYRLVR